MRIEIEVTDGGMEIYTGKDDDAKDGLVISGAYAKDTVFLARFKVWPMAGGIVSSRDLRDIAAACTTAAEYLERTNKKS